MVLLTGASGFIGRALAAKLVESRSVRAALRRPSSRCLPPSIDIIKASLSPEQSWNSALSGVSSIVHCAARVHVMTEDAVDPLVEFRRVNVEGTLCLARQAAIAGVKRFVFISSIKVNGECSLPDQPFTADQLTAPADPYSISKCEAENELRFLSREMGMEVVIIRPALVYGPGVKANFLEMMRWLNRGIPLPLGGICNNRRSLVYLDNLVDLAITCLDHPAAANQTFLVSDGQDLSTSDLLRRMATLMGVPARLIPVPIWIIRLCAKISSRSGVAQRLCDSLQVDISKNLELLGWSPPVNVDEGLRRTVDAFLNIGKVS